MYNLKRLFITDNILENKSEFKIENLILALHRIRIICVGIFFFSIYFFYADFVLFKYAAPIFRATLIACHLVGFILSTLFLLFYKTIKKNSNNTALLKFISRAFIIILLLMGSLPAISNQRFTGNIDAYLVVVLIAAVGFPFEIAFMLASTVCNHIIFLIGISIFSSSYTTLVSKQINSTAMLAVAMLFCYSLYRARVLEFNSKHRLIQSEYVFKKLFSVNPLPLYITRYTDGQIIMSNDKARDFYGYTKEEFNKILAKELYASKEDRDELLDKLTNFQKIDSYIVEHRCKLGTSKWVIANHELVQYRGEDCILTSVTDITELKKIENELLNHASIDSLTGTFNRRTGIELLKEKLEDSRSFGTPLSVCFIDIDNLKFVNDKLGHGEGDILIKTISDIVKNSIGYSDILFRYGGDEFVILLPGKTEAEAEDIWAQVQMKFDSINFQNQRPYKISASHGSFEINNSIDYTIEDILHSADKKMYMEKNKKKPQTIE